MKYTPDPALVEAAAQGDREAIEQLLLHYHPTLTRFARRFCATPEDVEDAVQETLWIASQKIGTLRVASAFVSWTFQVVRHQCYRLLNLARQQAVTASTKWERAVDDPELRIALQQDLVSAMAHLSVEHRQVLLMRDLEGMTTQDVAAALSITTATVKSRLHRARSTLRHLLKHWHE